MIYLCINLYKSVTKVDNYFVLCKKFLIFFLKICIFLSFSHKIGSRFVILTFPAINCGVRLTGLEPARRETPDPKSDASTNSATGAFCFFFLFAGAKVRTFFHSTKSLRANSIRESFPLIKSASVSATS